MKVRHREGGDGGREGTVGRGSGRSGEGGRGRAEGNFTRGVELIECIDPK